jgi:hypothetical protein
LKYKINFREDLKKLFLPLDGIRIFLIIIAIIMLIVSIYFIVINHIGEFSWFSDPRINILFSVTAILILLSLLIIIAQVLSKHTLSKFFSNFQGEFEQRFSHGFRILVIGFFIGVFWDILDLISTSLFLRQYGTGSINFSIFQMSISLIWRVGDILIALYLLYGFLVMISATKYYKSAEISPTTSRPE